jgi:hypothetical protein
MLVLILLLLEQTTFTYSFVEHIVRFTVAKLTMTYKNIIVLLGAVYNGESHLGCVSCHMQFWRDLTLNFTFLVKAGLEFPIYTQ